MIGGRNQKGLVDPRVVHVVGDRCQQGRHHFQRLQMLSNLMELMSDVKQLWRSIKALIGIALCLENKSFRFLKTFFRLNKIPTKVLS
jgi:hypothetical protein